MRYSQLFFDLDHTLWDYEENARETLEELFQRFDLSSIIDSSDQHFIEVFFKVNDSLWDQFDKGHIHRSVIRNERFERVFSEFGVNNSKVAQEINRDFIAECPHKTNVVPGAFELLSELKPGCGIHIVTNGFKEIQHIKLSKSGLDKYIDKVFISEEVGARKPEPFFFEFSLGEVDCTPRESLVIGDNLNTDIKGARDYGIDQVFYNPKKLKHTENVTWEISHLSQMLDLLK